MNEDASSAGDPGQSSQCSVSFQEFEPNDRVALQPEKLASFQTHTCRSAQVPSARAGFGAESETPVRTTSATQILSLSIGFSYHELNDESPMRPRH
jgi:hypothetical protein